MPEKPPKDTEDSFDPNKTIYHSQKPTDKVAEFAGDETILHTTPTSDQIPQPKKDPLGLELETMELVSIESFEDLASWIDANETDIGTKIRMANGARSVARRVVPLIYQKIPPKYQATFLRLAKKHNLTKMIQGLPKV